MQVENKLPVITSGLTKTQIEELAKFGVDYVLETGDPTMVAEQISAMEAYIKAVKKDERFTEYVREELAKNGGKLTTASGAKIEMVEAGVSYDYSKDSHWNELSAYQDVITQELRALEDLLKTIPPGKLLVDEESGVSFVGPVKTSKSTYRVTLAKK